METMEELVLSAQRRQRAIGTMAVILAALAAFGSATERGLYVQNLVEPTALTATEIDQASGQFILPLFDGTPVADLFRRNAAPSTDFANRPSNRAPAGGTPAAPGTGELADVVDASPTNPSPIGAANSGAGNNGLGGGAEDGSPSPVNFADNGSLFNDSPSGFLPTGVGGGGGTPTVEGPGTDPTVDPSVPLAIVPEPSIWFMQIVGFFGVGFALRRRKKQKPIDQTAELN